MPVAILPPSASQHASSSKFNGSAQTTSDGPSPTLMWKTPSGSGSTRHSPGKGHQPPPAVTSPKPRDIPRRPSPWHEISHSLSATSLSRSSTGDKTSQPSTPTGREDAPPDSPKLSSSQALRDWEARLSLPDAAVHRHALVHRRSDSPRSLHEALVETNSSSTSSSSTLLLSSSYHGAIPYAHPGSISSEANGLTTPLRSHSQDGQDPTPPKLSAEKDKKGHIEYKLKLINPSAERFERLVTQMTWRLKEGKNEAIYEIGLADDGTVVGLSREDMDASLRTLELMASEVGATVIVLKEIILAGSGKTRPLLGERKSTDSLKAASSPRILAENGRTSSEELHMQGDSTKPITKKLKLKSKGSKSGKDPKNRDHQEGYLGQSKQVIFDPMDLLAGEEGWSSEDDLDEDGSSSPSHTRSASIENDDYGVKRRISNDGLFTLDLDIPSPREGILFDVGDQDRNSPPFSNPTSDPAWYQMSDAERLDRIQKYQMKGQKAAEKREARRLDLLKGDGRGPVWVPGTERQHSDDVEEPDAAVTAGMRTEDTPSDASNHVNDPFWSSTTPRPSHKSRLDQLVSLPYRPSRPSSLRLMVPTADSSASSSPENTNSIDDVLESGKGEAFGMPDETTSALPSSSSGDSSRDPLINDLIRQPLDSLSLSFADVRLTTFKLPKTRQSGPVEHDPIEDRTSGPIFSSSISSSSSSMSSISTAASTIMLEPDPLDLICVEALVVRKVKNVSVKENANEYEYGDQHGTTAGYGDEDESYHRGEYQYGGMRGQLVDEEEEDEIVEYGGHEDGWGFGGNDEELDEE